MKDLEDFEDLEDFDFSWLPAVRFAFWLIQQTDSTIL